MTKPLMCAFVVSALLLAGCTKKTSEKSAEPQAAPAPGLSAATMEQLKSGLEWLKAEDRVLLVEDRKTTNFVQFLDSTLKADVPTVRMSDAEKARAEKVMARLGIPKETSQLYAAGGAKAGTLINFRKDLGGDVAAAVKVVEAVFLEIYELPPGADLKVERVR